MICVLYNNTQKNARKNTKKDRKNPKKHIISMNNAFNNLCEVSNSRDHNGEIEVLNTTVNDDNTISFESDKFSTYALAYVDQEVEAQDPAVDDEKDDTPKTGIIANIEIAAIVVLVATVALVVVNKNKNK